MIKVTSTTARVSHVNHW